MAHAPSRRLARRGLAALLLAAALLPAAGAQAQPADDEEHQLQGAWCVASPGPARCGCPQPDIGPEPRQGARGLRAILETALLDIMYEIPGQSVSEVIVNEDVIEKHAQPLITYAKEARIADI